MNMLLTRFKDWALRTKKQDSLEKITALLAELKQNQAVVLMKFAGESHSYQVTVQALVAAKRVFVVGSQSGSNAVAPGDRYATLRVCHADEEVELQCECLGPLIEGHYGAAATPQLLQFRFPTSVQHAQRHKLRVFSEDITTSVSLRPTHLRPR